MNLAKTDRSIRLAAGAWIGVIAVFIVGGVQFLMHPWLRERVTHGGEAAVPSPVWLAIDLLFPVWLFGPELFCGTLAASALATWRVVRRRDHLLTSKTARGLAIGAAVISFSGALVLAVLMLPSPFALLTPSMCQTTTFDEALSPNGRYKATVAEVDCGAISGFNRQVMLTRRPFSWAPMSIFYFNEHPALHLSWNGRTLTVSGDRSLKSMRRQPPDPIIWGGVLVRYSELKE
ncbi:MAG: hypothetical protein DMG08_20030 [Acidobacteria bacterium]|nr:MAG: hypothetical protein DMG08_20030 [Acidobacteriota bacterium]PYV03529.1 MAG: hypothetical protein DMG10_11090 [Acidobacteriota bacterium]